MLDAPLKIPQSYTQTFNKMRFIETEERDEISTALWGILRCPSRERGCPGFGPATPLFWVL